MSLDYTTVKVGQEYEVIGGSCGSLTRGPADGVVGAIIKITEVNSYYLEYAKVGSTPRQVLYEHNQKIGSTCSHCLNPSHLKTINSLSLNTNKSFMSNLKEKFANMFITEPTKSFIKLGIVDSNKQITEDGKSIFINWLLTQNQEAFNKEIVQPLLAEESKETK